MAAKSLVLMFIVTFCYQFLEHFPRNLKYYLLPLRKITCHTTCYITSAATLPEMHCHIIDLINLNLAVYHHVFVLFWL